MFVYKQNREEQTTEDVNRNLLKYDENPPEIKIICEKCNLKEETNERLINDRSEEVIANKDFLIILDYNKRIWKVPWFILIMCFLQISLFFIANSCMRQQLMFMPETIKEYWRYFTYMLLHSDVLHLTMNVCLQFAIGFCLESEQGHLKVACIYVIGGVAGSLATLYLQPQLSLMGASAGVYAMLTSHIPHLLKNFHNLPYRYLRILALVILFISDICFTTFHVLINHNTNPRICLEAHAAGAISGVLSGFLIFHRTKQTNNNSQATQKSLMKTLRFHEDSAGCDPII